MKLNTKGFSHYLVPMLFVLIFAIGGTAYLVASHADTLTTINASSSTPTGPPYTSNNVTINPTSATLVFNRVDQNLDLIPQGTQFGGADIFAVAFTIYNHNPQPIQYQMPNFSLTTLKGGVKKGYRPDANFLNPSGRIMPGQSANVVMYINPENFNNGLYQYSSLVNLIFPATATSPPRTVTGPNLVFTASLVGAQYQTYISVISPNPVIANLSKSSANSSGQIVGPGIAVQDKQPTSVRLVYKTPTPNSGFTPITSGLIGPQQVANFQAYSDTSNSTGVYNGSVIIQYQTVNQTWANGPKVNYVINLTN